MDTLRVRMYNVRFGDAILISIPDAENGVPRVRHILVDVGNALNKEGGKDFVFKPVIEHIRSTIDDAPIDLYIMTHEHLDHIQGLLYGEEKEGLSPLPVRSSWLPASSEPGYYERDWPTVDDDGNPMSTPKTHLAALEASYWDIQHYAEARRKAGDALPPRAQAMLLNNNPRESGDCVEYLRGLAEEVPSYIHRQSRAVDLSELHPFEVASLEVWAPEENSAVYYGHFRPMALGVAEAAEGGAEGSSPSRLVLPKPPAGVDAGAFYRLVDARSGGWVDNLLAIDQARNNSGIVFCLQWQGWRLLFTGDAEVRSWKEMNKRDLLSPVHFLKISHHASHNGTPTDELLEKIFPADPPDARQRVAVASTYPDTYSGIPDLATLERLEERGVQTYAVFEELGDEASSGDEEVGDGEPAIGYVDFSFPAGGTEITVDSQVLPSN